QDKLNHASLLDAALLSKARLLRYPHHQLNELARLLQRPTQGLRLIVCESVFSMDGSTSNLTQLAKLAEAHDSVLMIDDAHGIGVLGPEGKSAAHVLSHNECPLISYPLGKAFGCYGALI